MKSFNIKFNVNSTRKSRGFTLVELLVVMGILAVMTSLLVANISSGRGRARDAVRKSDLDNMRTALRIYYNDYQQYPADSGGDMMGCGVVGVTICSWGGDFVAAGTTYMKRLPDDPNNPGGYSYTQTNSGEGFLLQVTMENVGDESIAESQSRCGVVGLVEVDEYVSCEK